MFKKVLYGLMAWLVCGTPAGAGPATPLTTEVVVGGLSRPVMVTHAPGDDTRLYVVESKDGTEGRVRVIDLTTEPPTLLPTPLVTIDPVAIGSEQGLLGVAFDPAFESNGYFYVNYTAGSDGRTVIERYTVQANNRDVADAGSAMVVLEIAQPRPVHNGGWLGFGPDGFLYIPTGDGDGSCDPAGFAQSTTSLLGKVLRIDVTGDDFPADSLRNYAIVPSNPFIDAGGAGEVFAIGLRNPYRAAFDSATGDLYLGDVGQAKREEVDVIAGGSAGGQNFEWPCVEGTLVTLCAGECIAGDPTGPVFEYTHQEGCAIIGGEVYRGCQALDLRGTYFYADFCSEKVFSFRLVDGVATELTDRTAELDPPGANSLARVVGFGSDARGEVYICKLNGGQVLKIVPTGITAPDWNDDGKADFFDVSGFLNAFAAQLPEADLTGNGTIDVFDVFAFLEAFQIGCG